MRKVIVCNIASLDGYYEGPGRNVMVLPMDAAFDAYNLERMRATDTLLLGARSGVGFLGFWPDQADNPEAPEVHREFGAIYRTIDKVLVSDSLTPADLPSCKDTTTIVSRSGLVDWLGDLRRGHGGDILVFGSRTMWNALLAQGLVDELHVVVGATVLGDGTPLFVDPVPALTLLGARPLEGSDNVVLRYALVAR